MFLSFFAFDSDINYLSSSLSTRFNATEKRYVCDQGNVALMLQNGPYSAQLHFYTMPFYVTVNYGAIKSARMVELVNYRSNYYESV